MLATARRNRLARERTSICRNRDHDAQLPGNALRICHGTNRRRESWAAFGGAPKAAKGACTYGQDGLPERPYDSHDQAGAPGPAPGARPSRR
jgi:hypothetical protein